MRTVCLSLLMALGLGTSSFGGPAAYVISDSYKVLPDGTILEFNRQAPGMLKQGNAIWNSQKKEITLAGAKNETLAFQLVLEGPAKDIRLDCSGLKGPGSFAKDNISFHLVGYVKYNNPKSRDNGVYPDIVIPLAWKGVSPFSIPYAVNGLPAVPDQRVGVVLVEVKIGPDTRAGDYAGQIRIEGDTPQTLNLRLRVWDFALPATPSVVFDINAYGSPVENVAKDQKDPYRPTPDATIQAEHEFYRCASRHRAYLNILPTHSQRGKPYYAPALTGHGKDIQCDWTNWDKRFGGVLDGSIFDDKQPVPYFYLPFNLHWPYGYTHDPSLTDQRLDFRSDKKYEKDHTLLIRQTPDYLAEWNAVGRQFAEHFAAKGWTKTIFQVYLNHSNQANANSPWRIDEPYDQWGFQVLKYYADLTHKVFANDNGVKVRYRLDLGHFYCRTPTMRCPNPKKYDLPLEQEGGGRELLEPSIDLWYIGLIHAVANPDKVTEVGARDENKGMFIYGGGQQVMDGAGIHRALPWFMFDLKERGYCAWNDGCRPISMSLGVGEAGGDERGGNFVWYNGKDLGFAGPVPSLRMKLWRRGSYDADYLALAQQKTSREKVMAVAGRIVAYKKGAMADRPAVAMPLPNNNPEDYEVARLKLASMILGKDVAGTAAFKGPIDAPPQAPVDQITNY